MSRSGNASPGTFILCVIKHVDDTYCTLYRNPPSAVQLPALIQAAEGRLEVQTTIVELHLRLVLEVRKGGDIVLCVYDV